MIEGIMGLIGVLIGSIITYYSQHKMQEQNQKHEESRYIKKLKLEKYEYILEDIKHEIRNYSFVSIGITKILKYYDDGILTEELLMEEMDLIKKEGNHISTYLHAYDFLFSKNNLDLIKNSELEKEYIHLDLEVIPNISMRNIKDVNFRRKMITLSAKSNYISEIYMELLNKVKLEMKEELSF